MQFDPLPAQCLVDQVLAIRVRGLAPGAQARLLHAALASASA